MPKIPKEFAYRVCETCGHDKSFHDIYHWICHDCVKKHPRDKHGLKLEGKIQ